MEIRIVLDRAEPPAGRLRVVRAPGQDPGRGAGQEIGFTGWLGLLRALYEVTAEPGQAHARAMTMPRLAARAVLAGAAVPSGHGRAGPGPADLRA